MDPIGHLVQERGHALAEQGAAGRQADAAPVPDEELKLQFLFQCENAFAQCRRRNVELGGGISEV